MALTPGTRIGPYEVTEQIGEGGMGQVYRATDTKLKRQVAIKILPPSLAADLDRLGRFQREAEVLAALNHPHIAGIYGLEESGGVSALVMELVEGEDLSQRIARGPIPLSEALSIARQIAEALEAAHHSDIVHRDLKPANIRVRQDGVVKVLDFGLAKALAPASDTAATIAAIHTRVGVIVGTAAYMSPEQARGEPVGRQADVWSFGVVLYELLTGASPFGRHTTADTLASVLGAQPDYTVLPPDTPVAARLLVRRCLQPDRTRRLQHMGDARIEIEEALAAPTDAVRPSDAIATRRPRRVVHAVTLVVLAGISGWWLANRSAARVPATVVRLSIPGLEPWRKGPIGARHLAISEDGSQAAYASADRLWVRRMDQKEAVTIAVMASNPFFSPDGEWLAFFTGAGLYKVPVRGGTPTLIVAETQRPGGGTWRADGTVVFATTEGLYQVFENGGEPRLLARPNPLRKERAYSWPRFMTDGGSVLFTIVPYDSIDGAQIAVLDLKTLDTRIVLKGGSAARYTPTGHLVYASGPSLKAIAFDPDTRQTRGAPVSLPDVEIATTPDNGAAEFAVAETGTLLFVPPEMPGAALRTLSWVDRHGTEEPLPFAAAVYANPAISPDGTRGALDISGASRNVWIWNLQRPALTKLTNSPTEDVLPVWSRDSSRVFFSSNRAGNFNVYSQAADGADKERLEFAGPGTHMTTSVTPDGTRLLVIDDFKGLSMLNLARPDRLEPLLKSELHHWLGEVSPDGNWIAYESDESGNEFEVFLRPFPNVHGRREKVSLDGGRYPLWSRTGTELFYVDPKGEMMAASVTLSPSLSLGRVTKLFDWARPPRAAITGRPFDISPVDGRFLLLKFATNPNRATDISVVLNWFEELKARVPTK